MTSALHKSSSRTARGASLELVASPLPDTRAEPDPRDAEIARLTAEGEALRQQLQAAGQRWETELEELRAEAREIAAREFRSDDARRIQALGDALSAGTVAFQTQLIGAAGRLAPRLAQKALARLVELRQADEDWLLRVIERRLDALDRQAVVSLDLAALDVSEEILGQVRQRFADKVDIAVDPALKPGSARIGLRLGEVVIDPAAGAAELLTVLDQAAAGD